MKHISVMTPVYNEEDNIINLYNAVKKQFDLLPYYTYEHIFIDNYSTDKSREILMDLAQEDKNVKLIFNARNFGPNRSGTYGMLQGTGDCLIAIVCDLQDPPEMIPKFIEKWEEGYKVVLGKKTKSKENPFMFQVRKLYYRIMGFLSETEHLENVTGYGLFDKEVLDMIRWMDDPDPYIRGLIPQLGYKYTTIDYTQSAREYGKSSYNFNRYFDFAMTGVTHVSKKPLRIVTFLGMFMSVITFIIAVIFFIAKLLYWDSFSTGIAPIVIGMFFIGAVQLLVVGVIGEYIGAILTRITKRPMVVEEKRINF
ncbi:Glycosyltransferase involved in cell wall bisynthesis [Lachnospiraceae bacterium A10]|nr:Glycosyltransferase involved in cell wall bisynthesis [Lachnospiraceae bacterium A10]